MLDPMRAAFAFLLLSLAAPGQEFKPLIVSATSNTSGPDFSSFEFQRMVIGHEGPDYTRLEGEPSQGHRQIAIAHVYNTESVGSARFRLLDEQGKTLQPLTAILLNNSSQDAEFMLAVDVPPRPFRVATEAEDLQGNRSQLVFEQLFRPRKEPPPLVRYPEGLASDLLARLQRLPDGPRYALNERHGNKTARRVLAAYCFDIVEAPQRNPIVNPEKKNLKQLESEQDHLDFAVCREVHLCHSRPLAPVQPTDCGGKRSRPRRSQR